MTIIAEQNLIDTMRKLCDGIEFRLWIASPYLGRLKSIFSILGAKWLKDSKVSVRLITDIHELGKLSQKTIRLFENRGKVKTLRGLHAKIYIIDNKVLITSANLTATAFSKRYEVGCLLRKSGAKHTIKLYETWWKKKAEKLPYKWWEGLRQSKEKNESSEDEDGNGLTGLWHLPASPKKIQKTETTKGFLDYHSFFEKYQDLSNNYGRIQRLKRNMPIYLEIDGFLDYLFHHGKQPSKKYGKLKGRPIIKPNTLNDEQKTVHLKKYCRLFADWVKDGNDINWRVKASKLIRTKLKAINIYSIDRKDIKEIVNRLNCMNSLPLNKVRFLNPQNNKIKTIRNAWFVLLHSDEDLQVRMRKCRDMLKWFGNSSVQELLGFYYPQKYPIRNSNVNAGLRFFGYYVSID